MKFHTRARRQVPAVALICAVAMLAGCAAEPSASTGGVTDHSAEAHPEPTTPAPSAPVATELPVVSDAPPEFDRSAHSLDDPASIWVITNKLRPLQPSNWAPSDLELPVGVVNTNGQPLRAPAARAIEALIQQAAVEGVHLGVVSAYRPYDYQAMLYQNYVARDGQVAADTYSARPGHSEHQTGLAVDVDDFAGCAFSECFGTTPGGLWVAERAAQYGFVIRYPQGATPTTGFIYEPWHLRYVGSELAHEMQRTGTGTLEEFFGLPAAPGYAGE